MEAEITPGDDFIIPAVSPSRVLVVEDDAETRAIISFALQALGHSVIEAGDGEEAMVLSRSELPDVIVSDIMMPKVTGLDFVKWLRKEIRDRFIPVLFVTALIEIENRVEGLELGADDYLPKPFHAHELQARVGALLRVKVLMDKLRLRSDDLRRTNDDLLRTQAELIARERELVVAQLSGAAAHNLGQPVTAILLHCHLLEKLMASAAGKLPVEAVSGPVSAIRKECEYVRTILSRLQGANPGKTETYLGEIRITDIGSR